MICSPQTCKPGPWLKACELVEVLAGSSEVCIYLEWVWKVRTLVITEEPGMVMRQWDISNILLFYTTFSSWLLTYICTTWNIPLQWYQCGPWDSTHTNVYGRCSSNWSDNHALYQWMNNAQSDCQQRKTQGGGVKVVDLLIFPLVPTTVKSYLSPTVLCRSPSILRNWKADEAFKTGKLDIWLVLGEVWCWNGKCRCAFEKPTPSQRRIQPEPRDKDSALGADEYERVLSLMLCLHRAK